jgi:hypothetical protein
MSAAEQSGGLPDGPAFTRLQKPSPTPVTVVSPMMAMPPALTPKQQLVHYSPDKWEEFIYEWVLALEETGYVDVVGMGGSGDRGVDIAAFLTSDKTDGHWHAYQCKHYETAIGAAAAFPEILKIHSAVAESQYKTLPERYVFVAPKVGATLTQDLAKPSTLKTKFLDWADKNRNKIALEYPGGMLERALGLAREQSFSRFEAGNLDKILEQHATTSHHVGRFGAPLPDRPARPLAPPEHTPDEARYVQQLLDVYGEKWGCSTTSPHEARAHAKAGPNLQRQREAFYCAEQLRLFARDHIPPGTFESLQDDVYSGVAEVEEQDFAVGYDRLKAVLEAARNMQLGTNILLRVERPDDRKGICHQLANVDRLIWVQGGEQ